MPEWTGDGERRIAGERYVPERTRLVESYADRLIRFAQMLPITLSGPWYTSFVQALVGVQKAVRGPPKRSGFLEGRVV